MWKTMETVDKAYDCLDLFGASQRVKQTWEDHGFPAASYDIKISAAHDICSSSGVHLLLHLGAQTHGYVLDFFWWIRFRVKTWHLLKMFKTPLCKLFLSVICFCSNNRAYSGWKRVASSWPPLLVLFMAQPAGRCIKGLRKTPRGISQTLKCD